MVINDPDSDQRVPLEHDLSIRCAEEVGAYWADACKHPQSELRRGTNSGGGRVVRHQCLVCGELRGSAVKQTPETEQLREVDESLLPAYEAERKRALNGIYRRYVALQSSRWQGRSEGKTYFQRAHQDYLGSPEWAERRALVMERATNLCEGCRKAKATEVHHLTYRNWAKEFLFELVALCGPCHERFHHQDEDRDTGCTECVHAADDGDWCLKFQMPTDAAVEPQAACGPDRRGFVQSDEYGADR